MLFVWIPVKRFKYYVKGRDFEEMAARGTENSGIPIGIG